jgi:hypothetical protein
VIDFPQTDAVPVWRMDFSDEAAWNQIRAELLAPDEESGYSAGLEFVDRRDLAGIDVTQVEQAIERRFPGADHPCLILVDSQAMASPEHPVFLIDLQEDEPAPSFRALPRAVAAIEANLSEANVDFADYSDAIGEDGVFRGFS